jgi:hypothetical protein
MNGYNFRLANSEDKEYLYAMCISFYMFSEYSRHRPYDEDKIREIIDWYLSRPLNEAVVILLCYNNTPVGMLSLLSAPAPFWNGFIASEQVWWVEPEHRGRHSLQMIDLAEEWTRKSGCLGIAFSALNSNDSVTKIYEKKKYNLSELAYYKDIK